ncbi:MAG: alanine racemase [SAR324 cluster bacterium]|nr:alanine racemase [SAR324 cluster bacterium]
MPAKLYIDLKQLRKNISILAGVSPQSKMIAVLKTNAYGHGAVKLANSLKDLDLSYIAFANTQEGIKVKRGGYDKSILILGANEVDDVLTGIKEGFTVSIASFEALQAVKNFDISGLEEIKLHIKFDTGMNRAGIGMRRAYEFLDIFADLLKNRPKIKCEAIYSHMSAADEADNSFNQMQHDRILDIKNIYKDKIGKDIKVHLQNSAGILNFPNYKFDWIRPGLAIYGINPGTKDERGLKPILSWRAPIVNIRTLKKGDAVSYKMNWLAKKEERVATVSVGYGDGYSFRNSNGVGVGFIGGQRCEVLGRVCMDMTVFNLGKAPAKVGDLVTLLGSDQEKSIDACEVALRIGTVANDVVSSLSPRNQRIYSN